MPSDRFGSSDRLGSRSSKLPANHSRDRGNIHTQKIMNNITLAGNVGRAPELKFFGESGNSVAKFSIAVRNHKGESDWFDCEAWGKTAQIAADYLKAGSKVAVSGSVKIEQWEDKASGQKRKSWRINVSQLTLMDSKGEKSDTAYETDIF